MRGPPLLLLGLSACLPIPHTDHAAPDISGTLLRDGQPLANVPVDFAANGVPVSTVRTDAAGAFSVEGPKHMALLMTFGDRVDRWTLHVQLAPDQAFTLQDHGYWGGPAHLTLRCEITGALSGPSEIAVEPAGMVARQVSRADLHCAYPEP